jgi:hypothetical protein
VFQKGFPQCARRLSWSRVVAISWSCGRVVVLSYCRIVVLSCCRLSRISRPHLTCQPQDSLHPYRGAPAGPNLFPTWSGPSRSCMSFPNQPVSPKSLHPYRGAPAGPISFPPGMVRAEYCRLSSAARPPTSRNSRVSFPIQPVSPCPYIHTLRRRSVQSLSQPWSRVVSSYSHLPSHRIVEGRRSKSSYLSPISMSTQSLRSYRSSPAGPPLSQPWKFSTVRPLSVEVEVEIVASIPCQHVNPVPTSIPQLAGRSPSFPPSGRSSSSCSRRVGPHPPVVFVVFVVSPS